MYLNPLKVADEGFLVCVNDFLASGEIAGIFNDEDQEAIIKGIRNEAKAMGYLDTSDNCWKYFIEKVRRTLRVSVIQQTRYIALVGSHLLPDLVSLILGDSLLLACWKYSENSCSSLSSSGQLHLH